MNPTEQTAMISSLEKRLAALEDRLSESEATSEFVHLDPPDRVNRRSFIRLAGAAAAGSLLSGVARPAAAADGSSVLQGSANDSGNTTATQTKVTRSSAGVSPATPSAALAAVFNASSLSGDGLSGTGSGQAGAGVFGTSASGFGIRGESSTGYAFYAAQNGRVGFDSHLVLGPPTSGSYQVSDLLRDNNGNMFVCVAGGSPGSWRKIAGPASSGQLHLLDSAVRIYDTRPGAAPQSGPSAIPNGATRTIDVSGQLPVGASAVLVSVGVFGPTSDGFLSLSANGTTSFGINVYWSAPGTSIANTTITRISSARRFDVRATLSGGVTEVFVDVLGYYA